ncbi:MAG: 5-guanidino-2-oxopentanoate decarboxylase [Pseudomonadota bacterium]
MSKDITCGQALVELLEAYGVDTVFGIPGVHTLALYRGLAAGSLRHVLVRNEQGAGFMADGYARATGRPGVCFLITGPGVTNAATPMGQAYSDSIPMLVISSVNATRDLGKGWGRLHEITEQRAVTAPITAFSATAYCPEDLPELIARAFTVFASERPRPVHIEIPLDVMDMMTPGGWRPRPIVPPPAPRPEAIDEATATLANATSPVILLGGGAIDAGAAVTELAESLGALVITTNAAKGVIPESHPLSLGACLSTAVGHRVVAEADVVLALGTELAETDTWVSELTFNGQLIRVDIDAAKLNDLYPAAIGMVADAALTAEVLAAETDRAGPDLDMAAATARRDDLLAEIKGQRTLLEQKHDRVCAALRDVLPREAIMATDMTQLAYSSYVGFSMDVPRAWFHPMGFGTLGYALPAAIGAKIARPEAPVVVFAGDAGFLFTVQELATAVEEKLPLVIILWNNDALGQIRDDMVALQISPIGVLPQNPDFQMLCKAFGCHTVRATDLDDLTAQVAEALTRTDVPTVIELHQNDVD